MNPSGLIHVSDQCHRARVFPLPKAEDAQLRSRLSPRLDESWGASLERGRRTLVEVETNSRRIVNAAKYSSYLAAPARRQEK